MSRHKKKGSNATKPELPITPMLDMSFQLMAFFILTFRPAPTEAQLPLALPSEQGGPPSAPPPSIDKPIEDEEMIVQIYAAANGNIDRIVAALPTGNRELGAEKAALFQFLKEEKSSRGGKAPKLKYEIVDQLNYQYVIALLDEGKRAGYDSISPTLLGANAPKK